jgi:hypothetical protein
VEVDRRGQPLELRRDRAGTALEGVVVDLERQVGERVVQSHRRDSTVPPTREDVAL